MEPWYKITTPRAEVREGRSFNPDEFAIALEQVVAGIAPKDYVDTKHFLDRTCFTRALTEHLGLVVRRLAGQTENTPADLSLITQFGGGKTHTLAAVYHLVHNPTIARRHADVQALLAKNGLKDIPKARAAAFVGNAWDPGEGKETPWIDVARQLAGAAGVEALGPKARTTPPGTDALYRLFQVAGGKVVLLFDEVLNFFNRHRDMAEHFYAFLDNTMRAITGTTGSVAVVSLPRSQIEMTDYDQQWLDRINKSVHRVSKDLIANDESEISEVVRRRLFEDLGKESARRSVAKTYADWCFDRRNQLPPEWTAVDTATTDAKAREHLRSRFEAAYPFHPATISVFQRKWQGLPHYQRTRGTLAMFAQWISWAAREGFNKARREPLITLGSAPLDVPEFQATILGQLGDHKLLPAIEVDIAGAHSHAKALDATTAEAKGPLREIHRRIGAAVLFESTGVATDKAAHLPELRFALGEPSLDITSIDNAAEALEKRSFYIRKVGTDGFRIGSKATLRKVVADRRAALDESEVLKTTRSYVKQEFDRGRKLKQQTGSEYEVPILPFPPDGSEVQDTPRLTLIVLDPQIEWDPEGEVRQKIAGWTTHRGASPRLYPAALVWLLRKPGKALWERAEMLLAWKRVAEDISSGELGKEYDRSEQAEVASRIRDAEEALREEVWASYRYAIIADSQTDGGVKEIDLGAGHASAAHSMSARVIGALKSGGLMNDSVGAGYIDRNWPEALKKSGAWPLKGLRQSFLNGTLTRLPDPEEVLRSQIVSFVERGEFALASGLKPDGTYEHFWWKQPIGPEEVLFDDNTFLINKAHASNLNEAPAKAEPAPAVLQEDFRLQPDSLLQPPTPAAGETVQLLLQGIIPPEQWNRLGTKLIPKLRSFSGNLKLDLGVCLTVNARDVQYVENEVRQTLRDLGLDRTVTIKRES